MRDTKNNLKYFGPENCAYDKLADSLIELAVSEILTLVLVEFLKSCAYKLVFYYIIGRQQWREKFQFSTLADISLWMLYNKAIHWLLIQVLPFFVIIVPVLDVFMILFFNYIIKNYYQKAFAASEISYFLIVLMNLTFLFQMVILLHWYIYPKEHGCGPIKDGYYGWFYFEQWLNTKGFLGFLYNIGTFYPALWTIILIASLFAISKSNSSKVYKDFVQFKEKEYGHMVKVQNGQISRLKQKIEIQKALDNIF